MGDLLAVGLVTCSAARVSSSRRTSRLVEATAALEHLSDADAVAYGEKALRLTGFESCDECGAWVPILIEGLRNRS